MGKAELIEPFSDTYNEHAQIKKIPIEALKNHSNVEYAHIDGTTLHLQIITPQTRNTKESDETYPCIVYVQGSAWMKQNINAKLGLLARLSERGYVIAVVEYRHSGIAPFPAQAVDTRNAIRYVKLHAKEYKADANQMYVGGDSSGGHTAFFSQLIKNDTNIYPGTDAGVKGIISLYGALSVMLEDGMPSTLNHHQPDSPEGMEMGGADLHHFSDKVLDIMKEFLQRIVSAS